MEEEIFLFNDALNTFGYMASDIWLRTILIARDETSYHHMDYSFQLGRKEGNVLFNDALNTFY